MGINPKSVIRSTFLLLPAIALILAISTVNAQMVSGGSAQEEVAAVATSALRDVAAPVFTDYRGICIGMTSEEVRSKLEGLKKGAKQDFLVLSDRESAQIYYDEAGKVTAISIDYFGGENSNVPSPKAVLGQELQAKADGSMYQLNRYPEAGYWVSYNRTGGDKPIVTITMQKL